MPVLVKLFGARLVPRAIAVSGTGSGGTGNGGIGSGGEGGVGLGGTGVGCPGWPGVGIVAMNLLLAVNADCRPAFPMALP